MMAGASPPFARLALGERAETGALGLIAVDLADGRVLAVTPLTAIDCIRLIRELTRAADELMGQAVAPDAKIWPAPSPAMGAASTKAKVDPL